MKGKKIKIPPSTTVPVRLGTAIGQRYTPMVAGFKAVSTIGNPDFLALFAQQGLVTTDHQGDVTIMPQNCCNVVFPLFLPLSFQHRYRGHPFTQKSLLVSPQLSFCS